MSAPKRIAHVWTPDLGILSFTVDAFEFFIGIEAVTYSPRTVKDGTIRVYRGRHSGAEFVDYYPHRGPAPTPEQVKHYRAAVAQQRDHAARITQELGRSDRVDEQERARDPERRGASQRGPYQRRRPTVRGRRARA